MFNPYLIIALLVGAIGLFASGASVGYKYAEGKHGAALAAAQNTAIAAANFAAEAEIVRTVASAKAEADARIKASAIRNQGELDAMSKSRPQCSRDTVSMGLLNDAIDSANGQSRTPSVVLNPVRPPVLSGGWLGAVSPKLGVPSSGGLREVPKAP